MSETTQEAARITIEVTLTVELGAEDAFPDGAPDDWTAKDVLAAVEECGSLRRFIKDWNADLFGAGVLVFARGASAHGSLR